jgi:biopolymer transport protein ExbD
MQIDAPRRFSRPLPLTPLIDVVFLLLMFFMLSTTFAKFGIFGMTSSASSGATQQVVAEPAVPGIIVDISAGPVVRVNGIVVSLEDLIQKLNSLHGLGLHNGVIRVRSDAVVQDLLSVLEIARSSRLQSLTLSQ